MRTIKLTQRSMEDLVLSALTEDLSIQEEAAEEAKYFKGFSYDKHTTKDQRKDIKALKRVINFYSITPPYLEEY